MNTINRETILRKSIRLATPLVVMAMLFGAFFVTVLAAEGKTEVPGKIYELDQNSHYEFSDGKEHADSKDADTYGTFSISGEVSDVTTKNGIPAYEVTEGNLKFFYNYVFLVRVVKNNFNFSV